MSQESKSFALDVLRREYIKLIESLSGIPSNAAQKQQAFIRFDEGHMWMQSAIITYVEPVEPPDQPELPPADPIVPDGQDSNPDNEPV